MSAALAYIISLQLDDVAYQTGTGAYVPARLAALLSEDVPARMRRTRHLYLKIFMVLVCVDFGILGIVSAVTWQVIRDMLSPADTVATAIILVGVAVDAGLVMGVVVLGRYFIDRTLLVRRQERIQGRNTDS